jgi:type IV pilus biogenesis protein CpaD/CtpE
MEIKIKFREDDSALSRANYNLLTEFASIVVSKPTRAVQVAIPQYMTQNSDIKKIAARRLAIIEQVLVDNGVAKQRIIPMLSNRKESGLVLRILSSDQYDTITEQNRDIFGDAIGKKTYKSMSW